MGKIQVFETTQLFKQREHKVFGYNRLSNQNLPKVRTVIIILLE
jgi:hypothetical protein